MNDGKPIGPFLVTSVTTESNRFTYPPIYGTATLTRPGIVANDQATNRWPIEITIKGASAFEEFRDGGEFEIIIRPVTKAADPDFSPRTWDRIDGKWRQA